MLIIAQTCRAFWKKKAAANVLKKDGPRDYKVGRDPTSYNWVYNSYD